MKIDKETFIDLMRVQRKYRQTGDTDILSKKNELCDYLQAETRVNWLVFADLTSSFVKLKITNEKAEEVMNILGFEFDDREENEE